MRFVKAFSLFTVLLLAAADAPPPTTYVNDFEKAEVGKVPEDWMVLDGPFAVRSIDGNKCLELAGDPIGAFGALFGPPGLTGSEISARIWAQNTGKRFPEFGIGGNDAGGYKLMLLPGRGRVELRRADQPVAKAPFTWTPSTWTCFKLRIAKSGDAWLMQGKVWKQGNPEPAEWMVEAKDTKAPSPGRASIWANDYSEKPVRFDDVSVTAVH